MDKLLKYNGVQEALKFLREDDERTLQEHLEMCQIPAPSYEEGEKAEYVRKKMVDAGLSDVHVDEVGNVLGTWKGTGNGPRIMVAGHTDTVFPRETDLTLKKEGERYSCPGIGDDTRAVAELLSLARAMNATGIRGEGDIVFCANVCEEGLGDLRGIKHVFKDMADTEGHYDGFVSIDDKNTSGIIYQAVGSERYLVTFHGTAKLHQAIEEAVNEENARWGYGTLSSESTGTFDDNNMTAKSSVGDTVGAVPVNADNGDREISAEDDRITVTFEQKGRRPAGTQEKSCQIVQAANAANQAIGMETLYIGAASTDANIPISLGIPAITVGWGGKGGGEHTIHEWYEPAESWKGPQRDLLLLLALSGYENIREYQLPRINPKGK